MLVANEIYKSYAGRSGDVAVLSGACLELAGPESVAIVGPSGSGKSTLLNILGALERPDRGTVSLNGINPHSLDDRQVCLFRNKSVGFVFQEHHLLPQLTLLENVLLPTIVAPSDEARSRAAELVSGVGLVDRAEHLPGELSGGERQRAAIARALVNRPSLLLADEPTGNLDRHTSDAVVDLLLELQRAEALMLVVVTHSGRVAGRMNRTLEMIDGRLRPYEAVTREPSSAGPR